MVKNLAKRKVSYWLQTLSEILQIFTYLLKHNLHFNKFSQKRKRKLTYCFYKYITLVLRSNTLHEIVQY